MKVNARNKTNTAPDTAAQPGHDMVIHTLPSSIPGNITVGSVGRLLELTKEKEKLDAQASEILAKRDAVERQMSEIIGSRSGITNRRTPGRQGPRGMIKNAIITALRSAGAAGMPTQRIADVTQLERIDVERYIYSRSGKTAGIEKVDKGIYRLASQPAPEAKDSKKPKRG